MCWEDESAPITESRKQRHSVFRRPCWDTYGQREVLAVLGSLADLGSGLLIEVYRLGDSSGIPH